MSTAQILKQNTLWLVQEEMNGEGQLDKVMVWEFGGRSKPDFETTYARTTLNYTELLAPAHTHVAPETAAAPELDGALPQPHTPSATVPDPGPRTSQCSGVRGQGPAHSLGAAPPMLPETHGGVERNCPSSSEPCSHCKSYSRVVSMKCPNHFDSI